MLLGRSPSLPFISSHEGVLKFSLLAPCFGDTLSHFIQQGLKWGTGLAISLSDILYCPLAGYLSK